MTSLDQLQNLTTFINSLSTNSIKNKDLTFLNDLLEKYNDDESIDKALYLLNNITKLNSVVKFLYDKNIDVEEYSYIANLIEAYKIANNIDSIDENEIEQDLNDLSKGQKISTSNNTDFFEDITAQIIAESSKYHLLSETEVKDLFEKYHNGSKYAADKIILHNQRLVLYVAKKYQGRGLELCEMFQEGCIGLNNAIKGFDINKNCKFSTYAIWWIRQAITRAIADKGRTIRIPVHINGKLAKFNKIRHEFSSKYGREAKDKELAKLLNCKESEIRDLHKYSQDTISLYTQLGDEEDSQLIDIIKSDECMEEEVLNSNFQKNLLMILKKIKLSDREMYIAMHRFDIEGYQFHTLEVIADKFGITRERIRQIEEKVKRKIFFSPYAKEFADLFPNPEEVMSYILKYREKHTNSGNREKYNYGKPVKRPNLAIRIGITKEELTKIINNLPATNQELIAKLYDENYDTMCDIWTVNDNTKMGQIAYKIKKIAANPTQAKNQRTLCPLTKRVNASSNVIAAILSTLKPEYQDVIEKAFDEKNDYIRKNIQLTEKEKRNINMIVQLLNRKLEQNAWASNILISQHPEELTSLELIIVMGIITGNTYDLDKIAKFIKLDRSYLEEVIKKYLYQYATSPNRVIYTEEVLKLTRRKDENSIKTEE